MILMQVLTRTSITIPENIYQQTKLLAASHGLSVSAYISKQLAQTASRQPDEEQEPVNPLDSLGRYRLGIKSVYQKRGQLYEKNIQRKMGN